MKRVWIVIREYLLWAGMHQISRSLCTCRHLVVKTENFFFLKKKKTPDKNYCTRNIKHTLRLRFNTVHSKWGTTFISHPTSSGFFPTHISAPWLRVEALRRAGNKSSIIVLLYEDRWIFGHPPYTYDYPLRSPINAETEGHTESIMSKHRKDRDSWGECTYNISYFIDAQICFLHHAVEARTLPESMFISGSTTKGLLTFSWQMCIHLQLDLVGWERSNAIPSLLRVWLRASRAEASGHFFCGRKKKRCFAYYVLRDVFNKHSGNSLGGAAPPSSSPKASNTPPCLYFDHWSITGALWCICHQIM